MNHERRLQAAKNLIAASMTPEGKEDGAFDSESMWQLFEDGIVLAEVYLAEHPADDGEPVTQEWLRSVGFVERIEGRLGSGEFESNPPGRQNLSIWLDSESVSGERVVYFDHEWERGVYLPDQPTRGHVRRLCSALGIPLKESS